jgi:carboxymethylenebutenolidase
MNRCIIACLSLLMLAPSAGVQRASPSALSKQRVTFKSADLTLVGFLFKPSGPGPFPAIVWNHGSEKNPGTGPQFDAVARARQALGAVAAEQLAVRLLETEQLDDQLAGLSYVKRLEYVDTTRLVVAGCSYGGIQTLLAAERGAGFKAAIAISPGALSWKGNPVLQNRLVQAVRRIEIPVLLLQPPKDASLEPSRVLGAEFKRLGKPYSGKIYPAVGPEDEQVHCFGGAKGMHIWAQDALGFFAGVLR